jgi:DNA-binding GntR family transcriptional regulator
VVPIASRSNSLSEFAYSKIRDSILSGQLQSGKIYNEKELASQLGVSRTPVREALRQLSTEGIVTPLASRGVYINNYSLKDLQEVYELRTVLEVYVVEKIASNPIIYDLSFLKNHIRGLSDLFKARDYVEFVKVDRGFHSKLCFISGNSRMETVLNKTRDVTQIIADQTLLVSGRGEQIIKEHSKIVEHIIKGNVTDAQNAMRRHLKQSFEAVSTVSRTKESDKNN